MKNIRFKAAAAFFLMSVSLPSVSAQSLKSLMRMPFDVVESKWEINSTNGNQELNYYNKDFCDYYLYRQQDTSYDLSPGKNTIFTIRENEAFDNPFKNATYYSYFRGRFPKKFNVAFPYALPVKNGAEVSWKTDLREPFKTLNFSVRQGDTVYAVRGGTACMTNNERQVLVYHSDYTFAAYLMLEKKLVDPGTEVLAGDPVGVAGPSGVSVSFFFLDENKFEGGLASGYPYSHYMPVFRTSEGDVRMEENKTYKAVTDDALIMQEMRKREQKKYLKNKK